MTANASTRPTGLTITAWVWIALGVFMILAAVMGGLAYSTMRQMEPGIPGPGMPREFALMTFVFQNFGVLLVLQFAIAVIAISAGVALLRLRGWGRGAIEALSWLAVVYTVGFGVYWVYMWTSMTGSMPQAAGSGSGDTFQVMGAVMGIVGTAVFAVPLGIMIWYLRSTEVRQAISRANTASA